MIPLAFKSYNNIPVSSKYSHYYSILNAATLVIINFTHFRLPRNGGYSFRKGDKKEGVPDRLLVHIDEAID